MDDGQLKQFIDWLKKVIISSHQDVTDNYHTSGRKYYEGYLDGLIDAKDKFDFISQGIKDE